MRWRNQRARKGLRIIGPNCLGVLTPAAKFNGSFSARMPKAGDLALISQSGAIGAAMIEWAAGHGVGFSAIASVGDQRDVDIADLLDYFAVDHATSAILLYVEAVRDAREFMSVARAAARVKPVVVIKSGRFAAGAKAAATHTGALAGSDAVYDAAFVTARPAARVRPCRIVRCSRGARPRKVAAGAATRDPYQWRRTRRARRRSIGGARRQAAELSSNTRAGSTHRTSADLVALPPVDIIGDADAARFRAALEALLEDPANDAVLAMYVRTAVGLPVEIATALADAVKAPPRNTRKPKPVMTVWLGAGDSAPDILAAAEVPYLRRRPTRCVALCTAGYPEIRGGA